MESNKSEIKEAIIHTANLYRLGFHADAAEKLIEVIDKLSNNISTFSHNALHHLREVHAAQERGDTLKIADILQYEICPQIQSD